MLYSDFNVYRNRQGMFFCASYPISYNQIQAIIHEIEEHTEHMTDNIYLQLIISSKTENYSVDREPIINLREHFQIDQEKYNLVLYTIKKRSDNDFAL